MLAVSTILLKAFQLIHSIRVTERAFCDNLDRQLSNSHDFMTVNLSC